jgi:site-specific DNA-cytosine methylase
VTALQLCLDVHSEIVVDNFAGGGGASHGIERAIGRRIDVAINHNKEAIAMHRANHPETEHYCESVWDVDPRAVKPGRPIGLLWLSPDCFPAGTLILTDRGYRTIESVQEGDMVLTHTGRYRRVYATMTAKKRVHQVDIQGVPTMQVSGEHPFYTRAMKNVWDNSKRQYKRTLGEPVWTKAKELRTGPAEMNAVGGDRHFCATPCSFPALPIPPVGGRGIPIDERLMWLAGRYVGDGWTRITDTRAELVIVCGKKEATELEKRLNVWPRTGARAGFDELAWHYRETETAGQFSTNHRGLVEWLRTEFGHSGGKKSFPAWALGCKESLRKALLDGYTSADGAHFVVKNVDVTETTTISATLAFSTKALAESFGYTSQVFNPRKNRAVIEGRSVNARPTYGVRWRQTPVREQTVREGIHNWSRVQRLSAESETEIEVFNISVEDDETYIANGIVVHNCKHFSKAKGGKPVEKHIRALAWVALRWAAIRQPRIIMLENVEEFVTWGPLAEGPDGKMRPCPKRKGREFNAFRNALQRHGYQVEYRELRGCDYGAPTIRKRLFLIARRDGLPIVWPEPTHGDPKSDAVKSGRLKPWRTAAECIDWALPCPSIFLSENDGRAIGVKRPLADATLRRIAKGIMRYVVNAVEPFVVPLTHQGDNRFYDLNEPFRTVTAAHRGEFALVAPVLTEHANASTPRCMPINDPLRTICAQTKGGHHALIAPTLVQTGYGEREGQAPRSLDMAKPLGTVVAGGQKHALVSAFLAKHYGDRGQQPGSVMGAPVSTITACDHHSMVTSNLIKLRGGGNIGQATDEPLRTISAGGTHFAEVRSFLIKYYGTDQDPRLEEPLHTVTTKDRYGLVTVAGQDYVIADVGLRMLAPRELFKAQGFPADYIIEWGIDDLGQKIRFAKSSQVRLVGNSVCPPLAEALVAANLPDLAIAKRRTA